MAKQGRQKFASARKNTSFNWRKAILLTLGSLFISIAVLLIFVDQKVRAGLKIRSSSMRAAIYSDYVRISTGSHFQLSQIEGLLKRRAYISVGKTPAAQGEYQVREGEIEVLARALQGDAEQPHAVRAIFREGAGKIELASEDGQKEALLVLEPEIIEPLVSSVRASQAYRLADMPQILSSAVLATEDQRFYSHMGIDVLGIMRAMIANLRAMAFVQGGSTITQQLAKNLFLSPQKTLWRKFLELFAAVCLEFHLSKQEILELYLNEVYLGQDGAVAIHGVGEAARAFFGKKLEQLTISEAALLAGIIRAPSYYAPAKHLKRALVRRDLTLDQMQEAGFINQEQYRIAKKEQIKISKTHPYQRVAPHFTATLKQELAQQIDLEAAVHEGISIQTGLDYDLQLCASNALQHGLSELEKGNPSIAAHNNPIESA